MRYKMEIGQTLIQKGLRRSLIVQVTIEVKKLQQTILLGLG